MFLRCSYFLAKSEADVLINSVLIKRKACRQTDNKVKEAYFERGLKRGRFRHGRGRGRDRDGKLNQRNDVNSIYRKRNNEVCEKQKGNGEKSDA